MISPWRRPVAAGGLAAAFVPPQLWQDVCAQYPFLPQADTQPELNARLAAACAHFLRAKQFHGVAGLTVGDDKALAIAAQACLLTLRMNTDPKKVARWFDDFVGINLYSSAMVAQRRVGGEGHLVHEYPEQLLGEAMEGGPVSLSWSDVVASGREYAKGSNLVVHEFAHKLDMRDGVVDGCPPLPVGFMGTTSMKAAREVWFATLVPAFEAHVDAVQACERFGQAQPWLDAYGATAIEEFFPVSAEAFMVARARFSHELAPLAQLYTAYFCPSEG